MSNIIPFKQKIYHTDSKKEKVSEFYLKPGLTPGRLQQFSRTKAWVAGLKDKHFCLGVVK